jgi:amylosucrase
VRCHDDIGWAITPEDAARVGLDDAAHRRFLAAFYAGEFPGTFARGARFQPDPATGEARTSGTAASLAGLESAPDEVAVELAIRRILLLYAVAFAHGGLPLIYMGDELGLRNAPTDDPDNRWMHRPFMDWEAAARRHDPRAVEGRLWAGFRRLVAARRNARAIHVEGTSEPIRTGNDHVFGLRRARGDDTLVLLASFSADPQTVHGFSASDAAAVPDGRPLERAGDALVLAPYQHLWISARA